MNKDKKSQEMNRREFMTLSLLGTSATLLSSSSLADAIQQYAAAHRDFPEPVFRVLGRTGMKISVVSFGAMLTPEPEVLKIAFDHGVNYVDTAR